MKGLYSEMGIKRDMLIGRLQVKDSSGNILYNTFTETDDSKIKFSGLNYQSDLKAYRMHFVGSSPFACGEQGKVYLRIKPETPNTMSITMHQDAEVVWGRMPYQLPAHNSLWNSNIFNKTIIIEPLQWGIV